MAEYDFNDLPSLGEPDKKPEPKEWDWNDLKEGVKKDISFLGMAAESGARNLIDSTMNIPNAIGDVLGYPMAGIAAAGQSVGTLIGEGLGRFNMETGEPITPWGGFSEHFEAAKGTWPARPLIQGYNAPTSIDLQAGAGVAPLAAYQYRTPEEYVPLREQMAPREMTDVGEQFAQKRDELLEGYIQRREAAPGGAAAGDVLGDVASLVVARKPFVSASRRARIAKGEQAPAAVPRSQTMDANWKRFLARQQEKYANWFRESGIKITETGLEGAYLAAIQDEDPVMGMAAGAGAQAATNFVERVWTDIPSFGMKPGITRAGVKAGITAFGIASLYQMFKELTPGGRDRILESEESGYKKAALTMAAGAMLHASGFGRASKQQLDELGMLADTWHSARRGSVLSLISEIENDDSGDVDRIWTKISQDPGYFGVTAMRRLNHAFENDDVSHKDTIETLMEADRKFRRKVIALRENPQFMNQPFQQTRGYAEQGIGAVSRELDEANERVRDFFNE